MNISRFGFPTDIRFGSGARTLLPSILNEKNIKRPMIVTDKGLCQANSSGFDMIESLSQNMSLAGFDVKTYCDFEGNPIEKHVRQGVEAVQAHQSDALVIVGGGAALDVGKAIALMAHHSGHLFDYEDGRPDAPPVDKEIPFMVAIPTTAGTGSEVGRSSVISDNTSKAKKIIFSPRLLPNVVIADPELTLSLPSKITAATGLDALTHCVEAFLAKGYHPMCEGIALEGIHLISRSLERAVLHGSDLDARTDMLAASMMGAVAFQKGLGVTHSCAHALSTVYDLHHGLANGIMIAPCMVFNGETHPQALTRMARAAGCSENMQNPEGFLRWLEALRDKVGIPSSLRDLNLKFNAQMEAKLLDVAENDVCHPSNPRPVTRGDFQKIFASVF